MKSKVDIIYWQSFIPTSFFSHYSYQTASLRAKYDPIHAVPNAVHISITVISMTSLQFTQAQCLGYTRDMY